MTKRHQNQAHWEHFAHEADIGICGYGPTLGEAFEQAALALTAAVTDMKVVPTTRVEVARTGRDLELLFVAWIDAVIFEMAVRDMLFSRFAVHIVGTTLRGEMWGEPVDRQRHAPACEPKGATLTWLSVARQPDGLWSARCVVDV